MSGATITSEGSLVEAGALLGRRIQGSAEWRELVAAQRAARADTRYREMVMRHEELAEEKKNGRLDGRSLVEFIALEGQMQENELCIRQQEAWGKVLGLLYEINAAMSRELGVDFARNAAPQRGGCCG